MAENVFGQNNNEEEVKNGVVNGSNAANSSATTSSSASGTSLASDSVSGNSSVASTPQKDDAKTQDWVGTASDLNKQRTLNITETDGTTVELVMHYPGIEQSENIADSAFGGYADGYGNRVTRGTTGSYHKQLMTIFGVAKVNGAAKNVNFNFFSEHERKTYDYAMEQADSFLDNADGAFKA
ncbi:hypothetical protein [Apilactobacillus timberlakei]|uniref:hypothetical protein n=1 Tax=Apilactobacillus timberlakei TaxID=2008380 RepID=UPI00112AB52F|nr:hypothetical protein [Apilactobacillus timberlakei]TPR16642.1 hypothetical protein DYZ95_07310 [Apilactobacillus timberlakei]